MEITGTITKKLDIQSGVSKAGKEWRKQEIVVDMNKDFNSEACISFFGDDKLAMISGFEIGNDVTVGVNVSSKAWKDRYFHSIDGWRIDLVAQSKPSGALETQEDTSGDLPF